MADSITSMSYHVHWATMDRDLINIKSDYVLVDLKILKTRRLGHLAFFLVAPTVGLQQKNEFRPLEKGRKMLTTEKFRALIPILLTPMEDFKHLLPSIGYIVVLL